jgi:hypothetical protein
MIVDPDGGDARTGFFGGRQSQRLPWFLYRLWRIYQTVRE